MIQKRSDNTWWNWGQSRKDYELKQLCEPIDRHLIKTIAECYYFEDDIDKIVGKILRELRGRANPAIVKKIVKEVKGIK